MSSDTILFENAYYRVTKLADDPILVVVRSARPFESGHAARTASEPMFRVLDAAGREQHFLLLDSRDAVGNNNPAYEQSFAAIRQRMISGFPKTAVLVKTLAGQLHSKRLLTQDSTALTSAVFSDWYLAVGFLRGALRRSVAPARRGAG